MGIFSKLNQYCSSIRTVSHQYAHILYQNGMNRCFSAALVELIQTRFKVRYQTHCQKVCYVPVYRSGLAQFQF